MAMLPSRVVTRYGADGRSTLRCLAGVTPSETLATTTVKLRIRPVVGSHAITAGLSVSPCTSVRTRVSLASSGGSVIGSPVPPSGGDAVEAAGRDAAAVFAGAAG